MSVSLDRIQNTEAAIIKLCDILSEISPPDITVKLREIKEDVELLARIDSLTED